MRTLAAVLTLALLASSQVLAEDYDLDYVEMDSNTVIPPTETSAPVASTSNSMPMPTTTTPSPPSSSASTSPPPSSATPTPPVPANPEAQRYTLGDFGNSTQTCLNMTAVFKVLILNGTNAPVINVTLANNGQKGMIGEGSSCMTNELKATVYITESNQPSPFSVVMRFNGTDKYWSIEEIGLLINQEPFTANNSLDRNAVNVIKDRSFKCDSSVDYLMSNMTENPDKYSARVTISSLQVQVFRFKSNNGELGKVLSCTVDSKQNKIVPIAVGAALAGLVVVVLIAYLIGRLRSRKQSSYEALS